MSNTMELVVIPASNLPTILAADDKDVLGKLAAELAGFEADVTTPKGRAEIASKAHKVATAKMDLIRLGKSLTEGWRDQTKAVNAECRVIEERMDQLRDQMRAPLDEYQDREKRRVEGHDSAIKDFVIILGAVAGAPSSQEIADTIDYVTDMHADRNWEEFLDKAAKAKRETLDTLRAVYQTAKTREDEAEAARVAAEVQAEREREVAVKAQIAREERIAAEAAETARVEAERRAQRADYHQRMLQHVKACGFGFIDDQPQPYGILQYELTDKIKYTDENFGDLLPAALVARDEALANIQRGIEIATRRHVEEEAAAERERQASAQMARIEREKRAAIDQAERDRLAAIERQRVIEERERLSAEQAETAREAAARQAERDQIAAVETERKRVAQEAERLRVADEKRAADKAHRATINRAALAGIVAVLNAHWGEDDATPDVMARHLVTAMAKGEVDYVKVQY